MSEIVALSVAITVHGISVLFYRIEGQDPFYVSVQTLSQRKSCFSRWHFRVGSPKEVANNPASKWVPCMRDHLDDGAEWRSSLRLVQFVEGQTDIFYGRQWQANKLWLFASLLLCPSVCE